jgi:hypothetical protein
MKEKRAFYEIFEEIFWGYLRVMIKKYKRELKKAKKHRIISEKHIRQ